MNGEDLFRGLNYVNAKFIDEAETVTQLKRQRKPVPLRKAILIAAVIVLLAVTVTACAFAIQRIRMNLVQHNVPAQTETLTMSVDQPTEIPPVNVLTDCYPRTLPEGYEILCGSPLNHNSRNIQYRNSSGTSINFSISTVPLDENVALRPPVEESTVTLACGEAILRTNEGAQILEWHNQEVGYYASLFTDDITVGLLPMADSMDYGEPIPMSVWYHRGEEWNPWYPQTLPQGYACSAVSPVSNGYQSFAYTNGSSLIRYGISTEEDLAPETIGEEEYWEETVVNGTAARILRNQTAQRTLFWENKEEGFYAFLETMDETVDLEALAESVGPGEKMEVSKSYLGPDYTIELEQEPTTYIEWHSVYPQALPEGYVLQYVGDRAYGQQSIDWINSQGDIISFTLYFRLGQHGRQFEGTGQPESVSINGHAGYLAENRLLWTDEKLGFAYELSTNGNVDLIALAESVAPGPELAYTNDRTDQALAQLGDYQITALPSNMVEDGLSGAPLEDEDDWYSYVRRWYYDKSNNAQVYFTYETYLTDCANTEEALRMFVGDLEKGGKLVTIQGYPGILFQNDDNAYVAWVQGDAAKGVSFQLYSGQFTAEELLSMAESVQEQ